MNVGYQDRKGQLPSPHNVPRHIAVIMDGNGRWATAQNLGRTRGHKRGVESASALIEICALKKIEVLTLFAFGMENWKRPSKEVRNLFRLFILSLKREVKWLRDKNVVLKIIGDRLALTKPLVQAIEEAEHATSLNDGLKVNIAINYSGRWDILNAIQHASDPQYFTEHLSLYGLPEPDLFIRTGGVQRISNFMLWEMAYTELYFTSVLWPDFDRVEFEKALMFYSNAERRFGLTGEQLEHA